jgi:hypothetical protein
VAGYGPGDIFLRVRGGARRGSWVGRRKRRGYGSVPREFLLLLHAPHKGRGNFIDARPEVPAAGGMTGEFFGVRGQMLVVAGSCWLLVAGELLGELGGNREDMGEVNSFLWEVSARLIGEVVALFGVAMFGGGRLGPFPQWGYSTRRTGIQGTQVFHHLTNFFQLYSALSRQNLPCARSMSRVPGRGVDGVLTALWRGMNAVAHVKDRMSVGQHQGVDRLLLQLAHNRAIFPGGFFADGWGDLKLASELPGIIAAMPEELCDSSTIDLHLQDTISYDGVAIQQGRFESPLSLFLPTESKQVHFEVVLPPSCKSPPPMVVVLPSTGEHGFSRQRTCLSIPLAKNHSIGSVILEGPFYGQRRPASQRGSKLRTVADLINLSRATIAESRVLLDWLKQRDFGPLALCGASMGGLHSMMTASVVPFTVGAVSWVGPPGPGPVFTHGLMSSSVNWQSLSAPGDLSCLLRSLPTHSLPPSFDIDLAAVQAAHGSSAEREVLARALLQSYFSLSTILDFKPPIRPDACMFTVAESDCYMDRYVRGCGRHCV